MYINKHNIDLFYNGLLVTGHKIVSDNIKDMFIHLQPDQYEIESQDGNQYIIKGV